MRVPYEIWLCENGSIDGTVELCEVLSSERGNVYTVHLAKADYGAALRAGLSAARGEWIATFDADYYDVDFLKIALGTNADIVIGSKQLPDSHDVRPPGRRLVSRCFSWMVRKLLGIDFSETHGMKLFASGVVSPLIPLVRSTKDLFDTELVSRAAQAGLDVVEVPVTTVELRPSRSAITARIPRTVFGLGRLAVWLRWDGSQVDARKTRPAKRPADEQVTPLQSSSAWRSA
jgi:hypothetical protein